MGFKRYDGFVMHVPQEFIDNNLPVCPFCHTDNPHWLLDQKVEFTLAGGRTYYQCEQCKATVSSLPMDAAAEKGKNFAYNPAAAALNAAQKGLKKQEVGVTYLRVDDLGTVSTQTELLKNEYPITFFKEMASNGNKGVVENQEPVAQPEVSVQPEKQEVKEERVIHLEEVANKPVEAESRAKRVLANIGFPMGIATLACAFLFFIFVAAELLYYEFAIAMPSLVMPFSVTAMVFSIIGRGAPSKRAKATVSMIFGIVATALSFITLVLAAIL